MPNRRETLAKAWPALMRLARQDLVVQITYLGITDGYNCLYEFRLNGRCVCKEVTEQELLDALIATTKEATNGRG